MRKVRIIGGSIVLIVFAAVAVRAYLVYSEVKRTEENAALGSVQQAVMQELHAYYLKHRRYPNSLKEISANSLRFNDPSASAELVQRLDYKPDGHRYIITRPGKYGTHKVSVVGTNPPVLQYFHEKK